MRFLMLIFTIVWTVVGALAADLASKAEAMMDDDLGVKYECVRMPKAQNAEKVCINIKTTKAGELRELLGDSLKTVNVLTVEGPINEADYKTMWEATYYAGLTEIDLSKAIPANEILPAGAFFNADEQLDHIQHLIHRIKLKKIVLPPSIKEIGEGAFRYATYLTNIQFPNSLETIGKEAFYACESLTPNSFIFPNNLKTIGYKAFASCNKLDGEIVLPSTLERIEERAFLCSNIQKINFPENLKFIGGYAFYSCNLQGKIVVPNNCQLDTKGGQFGCNYELTNVSLPTSCTVIPTEIFISCFELQHIVIPQGVKIIDEAAFANCVKLKSIELSEGLETIDTEALKNCREISELTLPSTLKTIGNACFQSCGKIGSITCKAKVPPTVTTSTFNGIDFDIAVHIPTGTKETYVSTLGWNYFLNFVEQDFSGIEAITSSKTPEAVYDLTGKRVVTPTAGNLYIQNGQKFIQR